MCTPPTKGINLCAFAFFVMTLGFFNACPVEEEKEEEQPKPQVSLSQEDLLDPVKCKTCHETHYNEWSASMHAYASTDPVFLAMNRRGQRETNVMRPWHCEPVPPPMA
jgi:hypothetical protein